MEDKSNGDYQGNGKRSTKSNGDAALKDEGQNGNCSIFLSIASITWSKKRRERERERETLSASF